MSSPNRSVNYWMPLVMAILVALGMAVGFKLRESTWTKKPLTSKQDYNKLEEVLDLVEARYVDSVDRDEIITGLIHGMLEDLDPHSFYIAAKDLKGVNESLEGNFEGIGIEFYILNDTIIVVSPISGGPSEALGIMSGDKIVKIEDTVVAGIGITNRKVVKKLRGEKGTKVKVEIARSGEPELIEYVITRDKIPLFSVDVGYMVDDETGYIKINRFSATTYKEFMSEVKKLDKQGMKKLIIDLRDNPGGYLTAATNIADELLGRERLLVYTEGKAYDRRDYKARGGGNYEMRPLAVIINDGSASASEILAGAIQDWDRGKVVGRRSFGKGLVQEQYELEDGSALRLTVARYYTPSGRSIQRPYGDGNSDYYSELAERIHNGELLSSDSIHFADSLKFETASGRTVYGGGGIMPDIFVPIDTVSNFRLYSRVRGLIPEFVYDYYGRHKEELDRYVSVEEFKEEFRITDAIYKEFRSFLKDKGVEGKEEMFKSFEPYVKVTLKAYTARQLWRSEGFYPVIHEIDNTFKKTLEVLKEEG